MMKNVKRLMLVCAAVLAFGTITLTAQRGRAQGPAPVPPPASMPNIFGNNWFPQDPGSGSFLDWYDNVPAPSLQPDVVRWNQVDNRKKVEQAKLTDDQQRLTVPNQTNCTPRSGDLGMMWASSDTKAIQYFGAEIGLAGQRVYLDGRPLPDVKAAGFKPSAGGVSVGRWEGDTLVVETVGFPDSLCVDGRWRPAEGEGPNGTIMLRVPGGGRAKSTTKLTQRVRLTDPNTLQVVFTWVDPVIYLKPHVYTMTLKKIALPAGDDPAKPAPKREFLTDKYWKP